MNKANRNKTLELTNEELSFYRDKTIRLTGADTRIIDKTINQDSFEALELLPANSVDLLFADPPYNLTKQFGGNKFVQTTLDEYENWLDRWLSRCVTLLKKTASVYICGDWRSASAIQRIGMKYFNLRNRITWEREKGRGASDNWKNCSEDIWYFTVSPDFTFNLADVRLKKRVLAPYKEAGKPKDWAEEAEGNYRLTSPSNLWSDITVPFWSMAENTAHPTQKPEKLLAKIILASTNEGDLVLDPFLGSGTTSVVAKKLNRHYIGIEIETEFAALAEKRLVLAEQDKSIQGYHEGIFWERNSLNRQNKKKGYDLSSTITV